jgi:2-polyprenyl-6-methoxyphenol hydroxylase-like FAD-dependent oxidoreductase
MSKAEGYPFIGPDSGIHIIIVGAGLGGLACAIESRRKGHKVTVFENAPEIMRIGDTLVLPPTHLSARSLTVVRESVQMEVD